MFYASCFPPTLPGQTFFETKHSQGTLLRKPARKYSPLDSALTLNTTTQRKHTQFTMAILKTWFLTLAAAALFAHVAFSAPAPDLGPLNNNAMSKVPANSTLLNHHNSTKIPGFRGAAFWYAQSGKGSCGKQFDNYDLVAAVPAQFMPASCGMILILIDVQNGFSALVEVVDTCYDCQEPNRIAISVGAFEAIQDEGVDEVIDIEMGVIRE